MNLHRLVAGLHVLMKYDPTGQDEIQLGHDELYLGGPPPEDMAAEDVVKLTALSFRYNTHEECWSVFT